MGGAGGGTLMILRGSPAILSRREQPGGLASARRARTAGSRPRRASASTALGAARRAMEAPAGCGAAPRADRAEASSRPLVLLLVPLVLCRRPECHRSTSVHLCRLCVTKTSLTQFPPFSADKRRRSQRARTQAPPPPQRPVPPSPTAAVAPAATPGAIAAARVGHESTERWRHRQRLASSTAGNRMLHARLPVKCCLPGHEQGSQVTHAVVERKGL